jgi:hypothetical protein
VDRVDVVYNECMSQTSVRDIDPELWRRLRTVALMRGVTVGQLLNNVISEWLAGESNGLTALAHKLSSVTDDA